MQKNEFIALVASLVAGVQVRIPDLSEDDARTLLAMVIRKEALTLVNKVASPYDPLPEGTVLPSVAKKSRPAKKKTDKVAVPVA